MNTSSQGGTFLRKATPVQRYRLKNARFQELKGRAAPPNGQSRPENGISNHHRVTPEGVAETTVHYTNGLDMVSFSRGTESQGMSVESMRQYSDGSLEHCMQSLAELGKPHEELNMVCETVPKPGASEFRR